MERDRESERGMDRLKAIVSWIRWFFVERFHWAMAIVASVSFATPVFTPRTDVNPTADAGLFAPVIALCVAGIVFAQALNTGGLSIRRTPGVLVGVGSMLSAYLWIVSEARAHPTDPGLPVVLLILFGLAVIGILGITLVTPAGSPRSKLTSPAEAVCVSGNEIAEAIYKELIKVAKRNGTTYYSDIAPLAGLDMSLEADRNSISQILDTVSTSEHESRRPLLSAVVLLKGEEQPGKGFFDMARTTRGAQFGRR